MDEQDRGFLRDEYLKLQDQYEDYDRRSLTIKGWVSAGAALAFAAGFSADSPFQSSQWLAIAALAASFWYLEARWKQFQYALGGRIEEIESYFRGEVDALAPLQMWKGWFQHYLRRGPRSRFWGTATQNFVMMPYAVILAICALGVAADLAGMG